MHIRGTPISSPDHNTILHFHTIRDVTSEISLFIGETLKGASPEASWYTDHDIELLVKLSGGLFIIASTVLKYVLDPEDEEDRQDRLHKVTSAVATHMAATSVIDKVYEFVLTEASQPIAIDSDELERTKRIIACILVAREPLSVETLSALIEVKPARLRSTLRRLHSLVHLPSDDTDPRLQILHASFGDYLFDRAPLHFRIPLALGHDALARGCMRRLTWDDLCFNISRSQGHSGEVRSVAFSPDDMLIASASSDKFVFLWSTKTGSKISVLTGHTAEVNKVVFSSDGRFLASASDDMTVRLWRSQTGEALEELRICLSDEAICITFSPDDKYLAVGSSKRFTFEVCIWDMETMKPTPTRISGQHCFMSLAFSPDGSKLVSAGWRTIRFWEPQSGQELPGTALIRHSQWVNSVSFSPDGLYLASCSDDCSIRIWVAASNLESDSQLRAVRQGHSGPVTSVTISPDGEFIVSGPRDCSVCVWDAETGVRKFQPLQGHRGRVYAVAVSPDGRLIASVSADKTIQLWDARTGDSVGEPLRGHAGEVHAVAFSSDNEWIASGGDDKTTRVWNDTTRNSIDSGPLECEINIFAVAFSPDGRLIATGGSLGYVFLWVLWNNQPVRRTMRPITDDVHAIAFSPDSTRIVSGGDGGEACVCTAPEGYRLFVLGGHSKTVRSVAYSPNGRYIVSASLDKCVRIWNAETGKTLATLIGHEDEVLSVAYAPDGRSVVSGGADSCCRARWSLDFIVLFSRLRTVCTGAISGKNAGVVQHNQ